MSGRRPAQADSLTRILEEMRKNETSPEVLQKLAMELRFIVRWSILTRSDLVSSRLKATSPKSTQQT